MKRRQLTTILMCSLLLFAFQNCSPMNFVDRLNMAASQASGGDGNGQPYDGKLLHVSHYPEVVLPGSVSTVKINGDCSYLTGLEFFVEGQLVGTTNCTAGDSGATGAWVFVFDASGFPDGALSLTINRVGVPTVLAAIVMAKVTAPNSNLKLVAPPGAAVSLPPMIVGGVLPFTYSRIKGVGSVDSGGTYTAPTAPEVTAFEVKDAVGARFTFSVDFAPTVTNGRVASMAFSGASAFLGGGFTAHRPYFTKGFMMIDQVSGSVSPRACNFFKDLGSDVSVVATNATHMFLATHRSQYDGQQVQGLIKVSLADCTLDTVFTQTTGFENAGVSSVPSALFLDGSSLYVGGDFTTYRGANVVGLAKIDINTGDLDPTFHLGRGFDYGVHRIAGDATSIYVIGFFNSYRSSPAFYLAKLNKLNGALDTSFTQAVGFNSYPNALHVSNGFVYVGGGLATSYRNAAFGRFAKISISTGSLDTGFSPPVGFSSMASTAIINSIDSDPTDVYVGGDFVSYRGVGVRNLVKLNKITGVADPSFTSAAAMPNNPVNQLVLVGSDVIILGGFSAFKGILVDSIARVKKSNGAVDLTFARVGLRRSTANVLVNSVSLAGAHLIFSGSFDFFGGTYTGTVMKLKTSDFSLDPTFNQPTGLDKFVYKVMNFNGNLFIGTGVGATYRGNAVAGVLKVDAATGALDTVFSAANNTNHNVYSLENDGADIYIGGIFSSYRGTGVQHLAKLDPLSGSLNGSFSTSSAANSTVEVIKYFSGSLYIGGQMSSYKGASTGFLAKINSGTAALDSTFNTNIGFSGNAGRVSSVAMTASGLAVGGDFDHYRGSPASPPYLIDLVNGNPDPTFNQPSGLFSVNAFVSSYGSSVLMTNGAGGGTYRGTAVPSLFNVNSASGALDNSFLTAVGTAMSVGNSKIEMDGTSAFVLGSFLEFNGKARPCIVRLNPASGQID